jgi:hypothetical protein
MKFKNLILLRRPVLSIKEVNSAYTISKTLYGKNNLRQVTTKGKLLEDGFPLLADIYDRQKNRPDKLDFSNSENDESIEELRRFSEKHPNFELNSIMTEAFAEEIENYDRKTLSIKIKDGVVEVTIL